ncbi:TrbI/VirB10 family protein [Verminephrobacter aporrectodeae subsp. tuberculatae]|uniref:TrbI/VirB10 family protein n=2 Tax=Verminephrobacter aporrectodeae TaxID=1110389 RepID=UPI00023750FD|nr:TrbI/VirB10 family protein [Verminephrobacter aporrectodeae]MCW5222900.1 TrbI/VirB10 family protein [Verminephrobacter aporrectodeae subsp. tuberculatae]MCW5256882.1 TrbI/VirB10 family protein [Verminephrobacter aporrectodeae subsp. tuberculatae]MCW5288364.1 TrbI/VirB10 family protein [Verminephrobacter aporrectodeae subsp. tuberculatae]
MTADPLLPNAAPGAPSRKSGVRRVNNMPMFIFGGVVLAFMLVMALVAEDRAEQQHTPTPGPKENGSGGAGSTAAFAHEIAGDKTGGLITGASPPDPPKMPTDQAPLEIVRPQNLDAPPQPPEAQHPANNPGQPVPDEEAQRIQKAKMQRFDEAVRARTTVRVTTASSQGPAPDDASAPRTRDEMVQRMAALQQQIAAQRSGDPNTAYQARLAQIRAATGLGAQTPAAELGADAAAQPLQTASSGRNRMEQFDHGSQDDRWKLDSRPQAPRTAFELRAGFVVPATLISGINSDLPGQILAQVAQDVYDTPTGKHLLIPQGARLVGAYSSDVAYGQARVLVAWQRIVFPDGKALDIGAMPGADSAGYTGFNDQVNNHYVRLFASAFLMSGVTAGITYSQRQNQAGSVYGAPNASSVLSEALGQQLGKVTAQLIAKNLGIAPTLEIRPGYRFNVVVTKDLAFARPYRAFDY